MKKNKAKNEIILNENRIQRGKLQEQNVVFSLILPPHLNEETDRYLIELRNAFFRFVQKKRPKKGEPLYFAGMNYEKKEKAITVLFAFCPFDKQRFVPGILIRIGKEGEILSLKKMRRHSSHSSPSRAQGQSEGHGEY